MLSGPIVGPALVMIIKHHNENAYTVHWSLIGRIKKTSVEVKVSFTVKKR